MGAGRKTQTIKVSEKPTPHPMGVNSSVSARNLRKSDLGGAILGCKHSTFAECLSKKLFGLPSSHFSYVKNIKQGLPLFLFNYSDRNMHGIFEAASHGEKNIDPYAWSNGGTERTPFPAQVRIRVKTQCQPVTEEVFKEVLEDNYYAPDCSHFWFELDHAQTRGLTALFKPSPVTFKSLPSPIAHIKGKVSSKTERAKSRAPKENLSSKSNTPIVQKNKFASLCSDEGDSEHGSSSKTSSVIFEDAEPKELVSDCEEWMEEKDASFDLKGKNPILQELHLSDEEYDKEVERVLLKLRKLSADGECSDNSTFQSTLAIGNETSVQHSDGDILLAGKNATTPDLYHVITEFMQLIKELKDQNIEFQNKQVVTDCEIQRLAEIVECSARKIDQLNNHVMELELRLDTSTVVSEKLIYLIGGFNGSSWLSSLDSFSPSMDVLTPLKAMSTVRSHASATALAGNIFVFGGMEFGNPRSSYKTVECYSSQDNEWTSCPDMNCEKANLAGAALNGQFFAIGGGDDSQCYSDVEMFDPVLGRWIQYQPMLQKRCALAAAELNGALYAVGGYDGRHDLQTAERYDPRERHWTKLRSMKARRSCLSLATLNEKLYAIGGFDMDVAVGIVEIFDPRMGSWTMGKPMNYSRGYAAAVGIGDSLYAIGGAQHKGYVEGVCIHKVECYKEGNDWTITGLEAVGKRSYFSAVVL